MGECATTLIVVERRRAGENIAGAKELLLLKDCGTVQITKGYEIDGQEPPENHQLQWHDRDPREPQAMENPRRLSPMTLLSYVCSGSAVTMLLVLTVWNRVTFGATPVFASILLLITAVAGSLGAIALAILEMVAIAKTIGAKIGWRAAIFALLCGILCLHLCLAWYALSGSEA